MSKFNVAILVLVLLLGLHSESAAQSQINGKKQQGTATVSGRIVLNGEPLRGVTVDLVPEPMTPRPDPGVILRAESDEKGRYRISNIAAGSYHIIVVTPGFAIAGAPSFGSRGKALNLSDGEKVENFDLELKRGGVITGRVTDSNGQPLAREWIELIKVGEDGKAQSAPFNHSGPRITNDQGVYRITGLPEGRYLVSAGISRAVMMGSPRPRNLYYPKTFHPGVTDQSQARVVEASEGSETTGVDIFVAEAMKTYEIKGRVVQAETGEPVAGIEIFYSPILGAGRRTVGPRSQGELSNSEGEFRFQGVLPGKYALYMEGSAEREFFSEPAVCEVADSAIDGVEVKLRQGISISGVIVVEGSNDPAVMAKLSQVLIGTYSKNDQSIIVPRYPAKINSDGSFRILGVQPGRVYFSLGHNPNTGGFLIKRVERNGSPQPDGIEVGLGQNLSNVRVIAGYGNVTLRGEVKVIGGSLPSHWGVRVNLARMSESESATAMGVNVDARGQFVIENLIPGEYELRLVSLISQPGEFRDKQLSKLISSIKQKVLLGSNNQPKVTVVIDLNQKETN